MRGCLRSMGISAVTTLLKCMSVPLSVTVNYVEIIRSGWGLMSSPHHGRMLAGRNLCSSYVGNPSCCEFKGAAALSRTHASLPHHSPTSLPLKYFPHLFLNFPES